MRYRHQLREVPTAGVIPSRDRCRRALDYLASKGAPDGVDPPATTSAVPAILSHRLQVPPGCQLAASTTDGAGRIQCDSSMLSWTIIPQDRVPSLTRWLDSVIPVIQSSVGGGLSEERGPCHIEGASGTCAVFTKDSPGRGRMRFYSGVAAVNGNALMVTCFFYAKDHQFAPVCNGSITLP